MPTIACAHAGTAVATAVSVCAPSNYATELVTWPI